MSHSKRRERESKRMGKKMLRQMERFVGERNKRRENRRKMDDNHSA